MLNQLTLENFKAWRRVDLRFGKVTGFFGTNSAGKSSLLQFLLMLKQTRNATDRGVVLDLGGESDLVSLGTFSDVVHRHDEAESVRWSFDWTLPRILDLARSGGPSLRGTQLGTQCEVGIEQQRLRARQLSYEFESARFSLKPRPEDAGRFELHAEGGGFPFLRSQGRPAPLPGPIKTHLFPSKTRTQYQNADFLGSFELAYEDMMDSVYYLGPLREHPRRDYHWAGSSPADVGQRGERTVDAILAATRDREVRRLRPKARGIRRQPFQEVVAHWLDRLGLIRGFELKEIAADTNLYRATLRASLLAAPTALTDVGFGVSQVLPALVLLYYVPEGSTVLMEQPEIHLHPAVQSGLADLMLNVAFVRNVQIIVESHSEHLLRRLQRRVAESGNEPEQLATAENVKLYFVSTHRGEAQCTDLQLNEYGEIENWPANFFGDEMGEVAAIAEASLQRRMEQRG